MADQADNKLSLAPLGTQIGFALTTVSSGACTCDVAGIAVAVRTVAGLTVAVGDILLIQRHGSQRFAIAKLLPPPPVPPPPPPQVDSEAAPVPVAPKQDPPVVAKPASTSGTLVIPAIQTATYRDGAWRTDIGAVNSNNLYQGKWYTSSFGLNTGVAFYGTKAQSLSGATITKATVRIQRLSGGAYYAQNPTLRLVTQTTRPGGAPTLNETAVGAAVAVNSTVTSAIPTSWGQALVNGTRGGIAVSIAAWEPYMGFAGIRTSSVAWTVTLYWRR